MQTVLTRCWIKTNIQKAEGIGRGSVFASLAPSNQNLYLRLSPGLNKAFLRLCTDAMRVA